MVLIWHEQNTLCDIDLSVLTQISLVAHIFESFLI